MDFPLRVGSRYKTRDGRRATVYCTDVAGNDGTILVLLRNMNSVNPVDKLMVLYDTGSYRRLGSGEHDYDLVEDWVDPVYDYAPVWRGARPGVITRNREDALQSGANMATPDNPLVGLLRIDTVTGEAKIEKIGANVLPETEPEEE